MSHDTWIHRSVRRAVAVIARTGVTPNQLTTVRLLSGLAAAVSFGVGTTAWSYAGAGLFVVSMFFDRADGELARQTGQSSPFGHRYDLVSDAVCNAAAFLGIGIGLREGMLGAWAPLLGLWAGAAVVLVLWLVVRTERAHGERSAEFSGAAGFDPDDAMLAVPIAVIAGWTEPMLLLAGAGASSFALYAWWRLRDTLRRAP